MKARSKNTKTIVFLDTSAILAGFNNPKGGAGKIIKLGEENKIKIIISERVWRELHRNITNKFPALWYNFVLFSENSFLEVVKDPNLAETKKTINIIDKSDAPILASAIKIKPDFLITWNTKHFLANKVKKSVDFIVCTPADFLQKYWNK